jgi:hypothetical protein
MPVFADFGTNWKEAARELHGLTGIDAIMAHVKNMAAYKYKWSHLLNKLTGDAARKTAEINKALELENAPNNATEINTKYDAIFEKIDRNAKLIQIQFHQALRKHRHNFINLNVETEGSKKKGDLSLTRYYFIDTLLTYERINLINNANGGVWGKGLLDSFVVERPKGEEARISLKKYAAVIADYAIIKELARDYANNKDSKESLIKIIYDYRTSY